MADIFLLSKAQMRRIEGYFPLLHGIAEVDDRRVISGIIFVIRNGLRWSRLGVFNKIFAELSCKAGH